MPDSPYADVAPESQALFARARRDFSHGCIRVSDALGFARTLLGSRRSAEDIDKIVADAKSVVVGLPQQMPVYVAYFTVDAGPDGELRYHKDIYGHDRAIIAVADPGGPRLALR